MITSRKSGAGFKMERLWLPSATVRPMQSAGNGREASGIASAAQSQVLNNRENRNESRYCVKSKVGKDAGHYDCT